MRFLPIVSLSLALIGCAQPDPALDVTNATVAASANSAAVYATIDNKGGADRLTGIEVDGRVPISLHETTMTDGVMRMRPVEALDVPANGRLQLKSGGAHGMSVGQISADPPELPLTFRFERHAPISVSATVTGPGGMPMEHGH
ncbi:copper chaperone PCu(A)C [Sphingomonas sp. HDW15A]|uniref:copper chaperone PCu(A)C n=1 Tax=Sphingomonas sp. HDW15A TaxID=2714942 RepID=UPI001F0D0C87|nr:copper chaperone PCu(A)C [Sphingomonas sp. HDW15A]